MLLNIRPSNVRLFSLLILFYFPFSSSRNVRIFALILDIRIRFSMYGMFYMWELLRVWMFLGMGGRPLVLMLRLWLWLWLRLLLLFFFRFIFKHGGNFLGADKSNKLLYNSYELIFAVIFKFNSNDTQLFLYNI